MRVVILGIICLTAPAFGQTVEGNTNTIRLGNSPQIQSETRVPASSAPAVSLRGLDKMSGESIDIALQTNETAEFGYLKITLQDCRYPSDNPTGNAFAHLTIKERDSSEPVFDGWMIVASPALVALDHPRFDVWVIRCKLDDRTPTVVAGESSPRPIMRP